MALC
ncbi:hypothetical protein CFP56_008982 [Quercus suber]